jgi:hypothetical protein
MAENQVGVSNTQSATSLPIIAAVTPSIMIAPVLSYSASVYTFTFVAPSNLGGTGVTLINYDVEFKTSTGGFSVDASCSAVGAPSSCNVPLAVFTAAPFNLV